MKRLKSCLLFLGVLLCPAAAAWAQPANDNCSSPQQVNISRNNYDTGTFYSSYANLTNATIQTGENFYNVIRTSGLDQKTVWFRFNLNTARSVRVTLLQSGTSIPISDVGFTTYFMSQDTCFPDSLNADSGKLSSINKFGNSYHPCLKPGIYYVQVCAKSSVNDSIRIMIDLGDPKVSNPSFNLHPNAYNYGTLTHGYNYDRSFQTGCLTIDSTYETDCIDSAYREKLTQSAWFTFKTGAYVDWFGLYFWNNYVGGVAPPSSFDNYYYAILYEGDVRSLGQQGITQVSDCERPTLISSYYYKELKKDWRCMLQPNTTYSIKLLFHKDFDYDMTLRIKAYGQGKTLSPQPVSTTMDPSSNLGVLPKSPNGTQKNLTDYFSCESKLFHPDVQCGTENMPKQRMTNNADSSLYNLSTWFTFDTDEKVRLNFYLYCPVSTVVTIYNDSIDTSCSRLNPSKIYYRNSYNTSHNFDLNCLPKGRYSVHVQGMYDTIGEPNKSFFWDYKYRNALSERIDVRLTAYEIPQENIYSLKDSNAVYLYDTLKAIRPNTTFYSAYDTMACSQTLRPAFKDSCNVYAGPGGMNLDQVSYHQFTIGDYNNDALPDSGMLQVNMEQTPYWSVPSLYLDFYRGHARNLALSQNKWAYPDTLSGFTKLFGCFPLNYYGTTITEKLCVTADNYSIAIRGNGYHNGVATRSKLYFDTTRTRYYSRQRAANLGDISNQLNGRYYAADIFSCLDNPDTISGNAPCGGAAYTKLLYRQFYISDYRIVRGIWNSGSGSYLSVYKGQALDSLVPYSDVSGQWLCRSSYSNTDCYPLPPGWYTVISYGRGPSYEDPYQTDYDLGESNSLYISLDTFKMPKFNRPYKANLVSNGSPLNRNWRYNSTQVGSANYVGYSKDTCFEFDQYTCLRDTAWMRANMANLCDNTYTKISFYVFRTTETTNMAITGIWEGYMTAQLYDFDVRTDSAKLLTDSAMQSCMLDQPNGNYKFCDMKPGWYTLVLLVKDGLNGYTNRPCVRVEPSKIATNDFAANAYDFDEIPGDSTWKKGRAGDVHPENSQYDPSAAWIYCGTSAAATDPSDFPSCYKNQLSRGTRNIMPDSGRPLFPYRQIRNDSIYRRNIWYSFVLKGSGKCHVDVRDVTYYGYNTTGTGTPPFAIYESDETGNLDFDTLRNTGRIDSTTAQGLRLVMTNINPYYNYCGYWLQTVTFSKNLCNDTLPKRYYVLVEDLYRYECWNGGCHMPFTTQMYKVNVKYEGDPPLKPKYDHYSQANVINGLNEVRAPYTDSVLLSGTYKGAIGHFSCTTKDLTDQNTCGTKTIWYKFDVGTTGLIRISYDIGDGSRTYYYSNGSIPEFKLFRSVIPGDSTSTGLVEIPYTGNYYNGGYWWQNCISAGTYYLMFTGCNMNDASSVIPYIQIVRQDGDRCGIPQEINLPGAGTYTGTITVDCHSIGNDWGESSNLGCMRGPSGYKSSWFKININDTFKYDLTFVMTENTTVASNTMSYRLLVGKCSAMISGPCNRDLLTQFTINCMVTGDYYIQIFSPNNATGTVTCEVRAVKSSNQQCQPTYITLPVSYLDLSAENQREKDAIVKWTVVEEPGNAYWDVFRSFNSYHYDSIGRVHTAMTGNNGSQHSYTYTDYGVGSEYNGHVYYKLKQYNVNGRDPHDQEPVVSVLFGKKNQLKVVPNPAHREIRVLNEGMLLLKQVTVSDITGKTVYTESFSDRRNETLIESAEWQDGVYLVAVTLSNGTITYFRQVIQH